ncbi:MAG: hypothetical protein HUU01_14385, partial [Saprospiraceae bacterium]|nr:hypothetical protein [Saprospiraceae bacterium]
LQLIELNDKLYLLYNGYKGEEKRLLLSEIDTDSFNFIGNPIILGAVSSRGGEIHMEKSKNGQFFSVFAYWRHEGNIRASIISYGSNLQRLYEDEKDLPLVYYYNGLNQLQVDNEGNTFVIMEESNAFIPDSPLVCWQRFKSGESIVYKIENNRYNVRRVRVASSDEVVLLAGYYTEQKLKDDRVKGIAFMAYDKKTKGNVKHAKVPLPKNIAKYIEEPTQKKYKESEEEIPALIIIEIKEWEGHGYLIVGERRYYTYSPNNQLAGNSTVAFVSLVDYSLSEIRWTIPVCKYLGGEHPSNELFLALEEDKVNVFFNSYDKINKKHNKAPLYGDGFIQMKITPEGTHSTQVLYPRIGKSDVYIKVIKPVDEKSWLIIAQSLYSIQNIGILRL